MTTTGDRTAAEKVAQFLATVRDAAPPTAIHSAQRILLNGLRSSLTASHERLAVEFVVSERERLGDNRGQAGVLWAGERLPVEEAARCNALLWTLLLLDDMDLKSGIHPGGPAASAALAVAEGCSASGRDFLVAMVAGVELQAAVARAAAPEMLNEHGFAPLTVVAPLGAVASTLVLRRADVDVSQNAVGIAGMSGIGMWEMGGTASSLYLAGTATAMGVAAVRAALAGFDAPPKALDGDFGAFRAYRGKDVAILHEHLDGLGRDWVTESVMFQPFSGDTYSQAPLEALRILRNRLPDRTDPAQIESIRVGVDARTAVGIARKHSRYPMVGTSLQLNSDPQSRVAAAWLHNVFSYGPEVPALVADPEVRSLRERVTFEHDPALPDMAAARVEVRFRDGSVERDAVDAFVGSTRRIATDDELSDWFLRAATSRLDGGRAEEVLDAVWRLPEADSVAALLRVVCEGPALRSATGTERH